MGNYRKCTKYFRLINECHSSRYSVLLDIIYHRDILSIRPSVETGETLRNISW